MSCAWVISGGGARIVQALNLIRAHVRAGNPMPDLLVGSSAGGLLSILISHYGLDGAINEIGKIKKRQDIFSGQFLWGLNKLGMWDSRPLQKLVEKAIQYKKQIPYFVCSYDIGTHQKYYFTNHHGWYALASTACIPILVNPIQDTQGGIRRFFVDGGVVENTPLSFPINQGAKKIDVFMCSAPDMPGISNIPKGWISVGLLNLEAMRREIAAADIKICRARNLDPKYQKIDVTMHEPKVNVLGILDFEKIRGLL